MVSEAYEVRIRLMRKGRCVRCRWACDRYQVYEKKGDAARHFRRHVAFADVNLN